MADVEPSYIDYETFLDPDFSATDFANRLVLATNNPSDTPLDLSTPLSRVLFDVQEVDTHIDTVTTKSALPLLKYTKEHAEGSSRILEVVESQVASLTEEYKILEKEVIERYEAAEQVRLAAERLCETVRLGRAVSRALLLGRQLEVQMNELQGTSPGKMGDNRAMVRSANTIVSLRQLFDASSAGEEGHGLGKVDAAQMIKVDLVEPSWRKLAQKSQQTVREFSMSSLSSAAAPNQGALLYAQTEDAKSKVTSALLTLYLLSPTTTKSNIKFEPTLLISTLREYLQTALKASLASLARSLATLPTLDKTLAEISARCQNIVALEAVLESTKAPQHLVGASDLPSDGATPAASNVLQPLLQAFDTSSLPSYFWRSLASALSPRVQEIMNRGGVSARTLKTHKDKVRDALRQCVDRGSQLPPTAFSRGKAVVVGNWEREAAVMAGAVIGVLGR